MAGVKAKSGGKRRGAGRKPKADEQGALDLMNEAWPKSRRIKVIKTLCDNAEGGDVKAAALLMAYAYGKPKESVEHGGKDGGPIELIVRYESKK